MRRKQGEKMKLRPALMRCIAALSFTIIVPVHAAESGYPQRPIRLIIPQSPGGASDTVGRTVAQKLSERFGQQVVADNRPGATGNVGAEIVKNAAPDGYTMLLTAPNLVTSPSLYKQVNFDRSGISRRCRRRRCRRTSSSFIRRSPHAP
jgi:tripartite-type tricarboxylate transporter receptor subunit TctC